MLKRLILILLPSIAVVSALRAVDLNAVEVNIKMHPEAYRELLDRFTEGDTTLTPAQLATVYYGYSFISGNLPCLRTGRLRNRPSAINRRPCAEPHIAQPQHDCLGLGRQDA